MKSRAVGLVLLASPVLGAFAILRAPAEAQQTGTLPRVGYLSPVSAGAPGYVIFRKSLRELGYVEGQNVAFLDGFADGHAAGGLISYGPRQEDFVRLAVSYVVMAARA